MIKMTIHLDKNNLTANFAVFGTRDSHVFTCDSRLEYTNDVN